MRRPQTSMGMDDEEPGGRSVRLSAGGEAFVRRLSQDKLVTKRYENLVLNREYQTYLKERESREAEKATEIQQFKNYLPKPAFLMETKDFEKFPEYIRKQRYWWTHSNAACVSRVHPKKGPLSGNTRIEITGRGFKPKGMRVFFGNDEGSDVIYLSEKKLLVLSPKVDKYGDRFVFVIVDDVPSNPHPRSVFHYNGPGILWCRPDRAVNTGGTTVILHGEYLYNFAEEHKIVVNGKEATDIRMVSPNMEISFKAPAMENGTYHIELFVLVNGEFSDVPKNDLVKLTYEDEVVIAEEPEEIKISRKKIPEDTPYIVELNDICNSITEVNMVQDYLPKVIPTLRDIFRAYSLETGISGNKDATYDMNRRQFNIMCSDAHISGPNNQGVVLNEAMIEIIFVRSNREFEDDDDNPDDALIFQEFIGAVCRLAFYKFPDEATLDLSVKNLMAVHMIHANRFKNEIPFMKALTESSMVNVQKKFRANIVKTFDVFKQSSFRGGAAGSQSMDFGEVVTLLRAMGLLKSDVYNPPLPLSVSDIRRDFILANMGMWIETKCPCLGLCVCTMYDKVLVQHALCEIKNIRKRQPPKRGVVSDLDFEEFEEFAARLALRCAKRDADIHKLPPIPGDELNLAATFHDFCERYIPFAIKKRDYTEMRDRDTYKPPEEEEDEEAALLALLVGNKDDQNSTEPLSSQDETIIRQQHQIRESVIKKANTDSVSTESKPPDTDRKTSNNPRVRDLDARMAAAMKKAEEEAYF